MDANSEAAEDGVDLEITADIINKLENDGIAITNQAIISNSSEAKVLVKEYLSLKLSENADQNIIEAQKQQVKNLVSSLEAQVARGQMDNLYSRRRSSLRQDQTMNEEGLLVEPTEDPISEIQNETDGPLPDAEDIFESVKTNETYRRRSSKTLHNVSSKKSREFGWRRTTRSASSVQPNNDIVKVQAKRRHTLAGNSATTKLAFHPPAFPLKEESHDDNSKQANVVVQQASSQLRTNPADANGNGISQTDVLIKPDSIIDVDAHTATSLEVDVSESRTGEPGTSDSMDWDTLLTTKSDDAILMKKNDDVTGELLGKTSLSLRKSSSEEINQRIETEDNAEIITLLCQLREEKDIGRKIHEQNERLTRQNLELDTAICDLREEMLQKLRHEEQAATQNELIGNLSETLRSLEEKMDQYNNDLELIAAGENQGDIADVVNLLDEMQMAVSERQDGAALVARINNIKNSLENVLQVNQVSERLTHEREEAKLQLTNLKDKAQNLKAQINETEKSGLNAMKINGEIIVEHEKRGKGLEKLQLELNEQLKEENELAEELRDIYLKTFAKPNKILTKKMTIRNMVEIIKNELRKKNESDSNEKIHENEIIKLKKDIVLKEAEVQRLDEKLTEVSDNFKPVLARKKELESKLRRLKDEANSFKQDIKASMDFGRDIENIKLELLVDKKSAEEQMAILEDCRQKEKMLDEYICKRQEQLEEQEKIRQSELDRVRELEQEFKAFLLEEKEINDDPEIGDSDLLKGDKDICMADIVPIGMEDNSQSETYSSPSHDSPFLEEFILSETNAERRKYVDKFIREASELKQQIEEIRKQITGKSEAMSQNSTEKNLQSSTRKTLDDKLHHLDDNIKKEYQNSVDVFRACRLENSELWMSLQQKIMQNNKLDRELDGLRRDRRFELEYPPINSFPIDQVNSMGKERRDPQMIDCKDDTEMSLNLQECVKVKEESERLLDELRFSQNNKENVTNRKPFEFSDESRMVDSQSCEMECLQPAYNVGRSCPRWTQNKMHSFCEEHSPPSVCDRDNVTSCCITNSSCPCDSAYDDHSSLKTKIHVFNSQNEAAPTVGCSVSRDTSIRTQRQTFNRLCKNLDEIMERRKAQKRLAEIHTFDSTFPANNARL